MRWTLETVWKWNERRKKWTRILFINISDWPFTFTLWQPESDQSAVNTLKSDKSEPFKSRQFTQVFARSWCEGEPHNRNRSIDQYVSMLKTNPSIQEAIVQLVEMDFWVFSCFSKLADDKNRTFRRNRWLSWWNESTAAHNSTQQLLDWVWFSLKSKSEPFIHTVYGLLWLFDTKYYVETFCTIGLYGCVRGLVCDHHTIRSFSHTHTHMCMTNPMLIRQTIVDVFGGLSYAIVLSKPRVLYHRLNEHDQ